MNAFRTKLFAALFVPALAMAAGAASAAGDTSKTTGQTATRPSMNDKSATTTSPSTSSRSTGTTSSTTGMSSSGSSSASGFAHLDTNHDGKLSATEAAADPKVQSMWKKLDTNNDGTVSQAEYNAHRADLK